jgi:hypothetical protein
MSSVDDGTSQVKKKKTNAKGDEAPRKGNKQPAGKNKTR